MTLRVPTDPPANGFVAWARRAATAVNQIIANYLPLTGGTLTGALNVPDEAYGPGWNASLGVATKNALYDKIETISGGGVTDGDKGDIVVSGTGTVWSFDTGVVTAFAKTFLDDANAAAVRTTLGVTAAGADTAYAFRANNLSDLANAGTARTNLGLVIGTDVQAYDADLGSLAANSTNGIWARTGAGTGAARTITAGAGISVTNGDGVSGNPAIAAAAFKGALVKKAADQTGANLSSVTNISWDSEIYDTDGFHDNVTNNTRLTVPSGVSRVRVSAGVRLSSVTADMFVIFAVSKNGSTSWDGSPGSVVESGNTAFNFSLTSPVVSVSAGDYFELAVAVETDTSVDIVAARSWFAIEVIE